MRLIHLLPLLALIGCAIAPDLPGTDDTAARAAAAPDLVPLAAILAQADALSARPDPAQDVATRVAGLRARADRLRGNVIDRATRQRLAAARTRLAALR